MRVARTQPPVGYRVPMRHLVRAAYGSLVPGSEGPPPVLREIADTLGVRYAFAVSSGKAALATVLEALLDRSRRRKVILPAYTCYSVPSAVRKAGLDPVPCDIAAGSFDYDYDQLGSLLGDDVLCVLSVHLFGIPSDTNRLNGMCQPLGIFVVEDAAQALGVQHAGSWLGTRADVGFFSLGRGKNITAGSGGLIVTNSDEIGRNLQARIGRLPPSRLTDDIRTCVLLSLSSLFISPWLFWLPAGLPFLKLGETLFHGDFPIRRFSTFQLMLLRDWRARLDVLAASRRRAASVYLARIVGAKDYAPELAYLRFPLLVDSQVKDRILSEGAGRRYGISHMYPTSVGAIPELQGCLRETRFPEAERVCRSLLTLPTHPLLSEGDLLRISDIINAAGRRSEA